MGAPIWLGIVIAGCIAHLGGSTLASLIAAAATVVVLYVASWCIPYEYHENKAGALASGSSGGGDLAASQDAAGNVPDREHIERVEQAAQIFTRSSER